ncbi:MAG: aminotransferase class V-fold PLP-dependent enzyme [Pirellula sp.]|jgi:cysteine desulfurase/selenocysteine lyase
MTRHYLDHAATTWPKPPGVIEAVVDYQSMCGAPASRGLYTSGLDANQIVLETRRAVRDYFHIPSVDDIAFCSNGTHALNEAIFGLAYGKGRKPIHVVTTSIEHNSVLRPLELAASRGWLEWNAVECSSSGLVDPDDVLKAIQSTTRVLIISHVSNVTGAVQNLLALSQIAKSRELIFMVDASQSAGYLPIDVRSQGIDILATAGHKGLCGMLGSGILYVRSGLQREMAPMCIGGTGESSDRIDGDFPWQSSVESGNQNVPALASLLAGLRWKASSVAPPFEAWNDQILATIRDRENLMLVGIDSKSVNDRLPVFSLIPKKSSSLLQTPQEMAMFLDSANRIECRAGFHCAGKIHDSLGTRQHGGTLRLSLGCTTTQLDVDAACQGLVMLDKMMDA